MCVVVCGLCDVELRALPLVLLLLLLLLLPE